MKYTFDDFGVDTNSAALTKVVDRNGNEIDLGYSYDVGYSYGGWTSMTDTHGMSWVIVHNSAGLITSIESVGTLRCTSPSRGNPHRSANPSTGTRPADDTRFGSSKSARHTGRI